MKTILLNTLFFLSWVVMVVAVLVESFPGAMVGFVCSLAAGVMIRVEQRKN